MGLLRSLSGRLLVVTIAVVMLAEIAIFVPSVARFREDYLMERVRRAEIAALTVLAAPDQMVSRDLENELISRAEVLNVVVRRDGIREMVLTSGTLAPITASYDLREPSILELIRDALLRIAATEGGVIRIIAYAPADMGKELEITLRAGPLTDAMRQYGLNILILSLAISVVTSVMVFVAVRRAVVSPITGVIENLKHFSENPEDPERAIVPRSRVGEIAEAESAVAEMQRDVQAALKSRARLASLGEAVAKISHDLRNILATTQLMVDRLEMSQDPIVGRTTPKLLNSLDRAIRLCQSTLTYGKAEEAPPETRIVAVSDLALEVAEGLGLVPGDASVSCSIEIAADVVAEADPEHLYRVLNNLMRNAAQAIRNTDRPGTITIGAETLDGSVAITVEDTGPGLPAKSLQHLFKPFRGSSSREGTGLGLAIAHELITVNRGKLELVASTTAGTQFCITLPGRAAMAAE
ncbi:MAG: HAMP domain-containing sensor histidine kinase [Pseudomonadota bacterium]